ncbi:MAG: sulfite exporter TauE/SafE family protein [Proteobacteria bacterium]|nr:sulfite exporter TauE/SafE family protein [Pseudomonadota bacterium]MBU1743306.1 sulfite exporter TauE/SafE family protein [Pseudomonadota bacterium]MBU1964972.1 sulfite exporter TauE/SafE family protein [Pseudomonadota bacterium]
MVFDGVTVAVLLIILVSTLVRAVFGFGNALIAMPLLAMTPIGMKTATPLVALIATILSLVILVKDWRIIDLRSVWRLLVATIPGIPLGLILLKGPYESTGKIILALIIVGFSLYCLFRPRLFTRGHLAARCPPREWAAYPFGLLAGILGGAYNTNGPPVIIYGTIRRWAPDRFRANLQGYFLPSNVIIIAGHGMGGLWTPSVGWYFLLSLPLILLSIWIGNHLNRMIPPGRFDRYIHLLLILVGALLFIQTVISGSSG